MHRNTRAITLIPALTALAVLSTSAPGYAATTVNVGSNPTPRTVAYAASSPWAVLESNYGVSIACAAGTASGTINAGDPAPGPSIGTMDAASWTCFWPRAFNVTQTTTWTLNAVTDGASGIADLEVTGIVSFEWRSVTPGECDFDLDGTHEAAFDTSTQELAFTDTADDFPLWVSNVNGCFGEILDGDQAHLDVTFDLSTAEGPVTFL